jgi:hypothetical protein
MIEALRRPAYDEGTELEEAVDVWKERFELARRAAVFEIEQSGWNQQVRRSVTGDRPQRTFDKK